MTRTAIVPVEMLGESLLAVRAVMHDAHHRGYQACCGNRHGECCGNFVIEWHPDDTAVMDGLHPAEQKLTAMVNARPAVPDELIEEAAKAIYCAATNSDPKCWRGYADHYEREHLRNMARAAARVFNGGEDE